MNKLEKIFEKALKETLIVENSKVQTGHNLIILRSALGSGRYKTNIGNQISRAMDKPNELVSELGLKKPTGDTILERARNILEQANSNEIMSYFFEKPTPPAKRNAAVDTGAGLVGKEIFTVSVPLTPENEKILGGYRDSCYYMWLTLVAAYNAGILKTDKKIMFMPEQKGLRYPTIYVDE